MDLPLRRTEVVTAQKVADELIATMSLKRKGVGIKRHLVPEAVWRPSTRAWFAEAADGDEVEIAVDLDFIEPPTIRSVRLASAVDDGPATPPAAVTAGARSQAVPSRRIGPPPPLRRQGTTEPVPPQIDPDVEARQRAVLTYGGGVNPYTFIPAPPREDLPAGFADEPPRSQARYDTDHEWVGTLAVQLEALTPLLLPDTQNTPRGGQPVHREYPVRLGPDGRPYIAGASLKGALRSAYEIVTASRFGVFTGHDLRLAFRRSAGDSLHLVPARVELDPAGVLGFRLCRGDTDWQASGALEAAWVPAYPSRPVQIGALRGKPLASIPNQVFARVQLFEHPPGNNQAAFRVWRVTHLAPDALSLAKPEGRPPSLGSLTAVPGTKPRIVAGWLSVTGRSTRKHDERLFVTTAHDTVVAIDPVHHEFWRSVMQAYRAAAEATKTDGGRPSRYLNFPSPDRLVEGEMVHLQLGPPGPSSSQPTVIGVHPVMIGRQPFDFSPAEKLDESLHPAAELSKLSMADRVFGWAPASGRGSRQTSTGYRGRLRPGVVRCETQDWQGAGTPDAPLTLVPLSSPKPTQFRFYAAKDDSGTPIDRGARKETGYSAGSGLRGRKAYWYPVGLPRDYWTPGLPAERLPDSRFREYQASDGKQTTQNSSHQGSVRVGAMFTVDLQVDGLTALELGALVWLLTRPTGCALRLGAAKPLGFGAVRASIDWSRSRLLTGADLRANWLQLQRPAHAAPDDVKALGDEFDRICRAHPVLQEALEGFEKVIAGMEHPVHYPRTRDEPELETYGWFGSNEKERIRTITHGHALPHVTDADQRLPRLPRS